MVAQRSDDRVPNLPESLWLLLRPVRDVTADPANPEPAAACAVFPQTGLLPARPQCQHRRAASRAAGRKSPGAGPVAGPLPAWSAGILHPCSQTMPARICCAVSRFWAGPGRGQKCYDGRTHGEVGENHPLPRSSSRGSTWYMVGQVKQSFGAYIEVGIPQQPLHVRPHGLVLDAERIVTAFRRTSAEGWISRPPDPRVHALCRSTSNRLSA